APVCSRRTRISVASLLPPPRRRCSERGSFTAVRLCSHRTHPCRAPAAAAAVAADRVDPGNHLFRRGGEPRPLARAEDWFRRSLSRGVALQKAVSYRAPV